MITIIWAITAGLMVGCYIMTVITGRIAKRNLAQILRRFAENVRKDTLDETIHQVKWVADFLDPQKPSSKETK